MPGQSEYADVPVGLSVLPVLRRSAIWEASGRGVASTLTTPGHQACCGLNWVTVRARASWAVVVHCGTPARSPISRALR